MIFTGKTSGSWTSARGDDNRSRLIGLICAHDIEGAVIEPLNGFNNAIDAFCAGLRRMFLQLHTELRAGNGWYGGIVFNDIRRGNLAARHALLYDDGFQTCSRSVDGCCIASWTAPDDHGVYHTIRLIHIAPRIQRSYHAKVLIPALSLPYSTLTSVPNCMHKT